jgi:ubiquinone/menaquinone biosynthesis C-methylase UbiE
MLAETERNPSMMEVGSQESEEARIRAAYACRPLGARRYSAFNPGNLVVNYEIETAVLKLLRSQGRTELATQRILDVGCGDGQWLRRMLEWGARPDHLTGIDLLPDRIAAARWLCPADVELVCGSACQLPHSDATFDLIFQFTVFTSILDFEVKRHLAHEMLRVLKSDGLIVWFDYHVSNPANHQARGIGKREILRLFPGCGVRLYRIMLAPPLSRLLARYSMIACMLLGKIPLLRTHYLGSIQKGSR